jgi:hypothetical protein
MIKRLLVLFSLAVLAVFLAAPALADWEEGDFHKMHYPQLPDRNGWDVKASWSKVLADDWRCSETGDVEDIHFWGSWYKDDWRDEGNPASSFEWFSISIYADIPDPDGTGPEFSKPGALLWTRVFKPEQVDVRLWGTGEQGWYDPNSGQWEYPNHVMNFQYNIENIQNPFPQKAGTIYWLAISMECNYGEWGWKTSLDHWNDDGVWADYEPGGPTPWTELRDPRTTPGESLDMAFVITPEPAAVVCLALGSLLLCRRMRC